MKSIWIISCRSPHVCNILNGLKTQELRTRIGLIKEGDEMHLYCTKSRPWLYFGEFGGHYQLEYSVGKWGDEMNGKVVAKFIVGKVEKIDDHYTDSNLHFLDILFHACLTVVDYFKYSKNKDCYALSITQLEIFDKPRELGEYLAYKAQRSLLSDGFYHPITRAPQSYCHAWVEE